MNHKEYEEYHKKFDKCLKARVSRFEAASTSAGFGQSIERTRLVAFALDEHERLLLSEQPVARDDRTEEDVRVAMERAEGEDRWRWEGEEFEKSAYRQAFRAFAILLKNAETEEAIALNSERLSMSTDDKEQQLLSYQVTRDRKLLDAVASIVKDAQRVLLELGLPVTLDKFSSNEFRIWIDTDCCKLSPAEFVISLEERWAEHFLPLPDDPEVVGEDEL